MTKEKNLIPRPDRVCAYDLERPGLLSFSGGRTSGFMLREVLNYYNDKLPDDIYVVFANTGKEMNETLDFVRDCSVNWNVKTFGS